MFHKSFEQRVSLLVQRYTFFKNVFAGDRRRLYTAVNQFIVQPLVLSVLDLIWLFIGFPSPGTVDHLCTLQIYASLTVPSIGEQALYIQRYTYLLTIRIYYFT